MADETGWDPKPYLTYLDKEMTIMGLLSAFSLALASFATGKIAGAEKGFLAALWEHGQAHVVAGAAAAFAAAFFFYLQRSHLAWYYGQIALAHVRGDDLKQLLKDADGWATWTRYQTGFVALTLSLACYAYGVAEELSPAWRSVPHAWSLWVPAAAALAIGFVRWCVLSARPYDDYPFRFRS